VQEPALQGAEGGAGQGGAAGAAAAHQHHHQLLLPGQGEQRARRAQQAHEAPGGARTGQGHFLSGLGRTASPPRAAS